MKKKLTILAILALLVCALVPMSTASAATYSIIGGTNGTPYDLSTLSDGDVLEIKTSELVELTGNGGDIQIRCDAGSNVELIDVTIANTANTDIPISFTGNGNQLTITGTNSLTAGLYTDAVHLCADAELTVLGTGTLNAIGGAGDAVNSVAGGCGIGCVTDDCTITIMSGTINATGGRYVPGIGGGLNARGDVIIQGGTITAQGGAFAAGIGGGMYGDGVVTTIDGTIEATGGQYGAGIGGGQYGEGSLQLNGGTIEAIGGQYAAGIGGGAYSDGMMDIRGGTIKATGGSRAAGIGGGWEGYAEIYMYDGLIWATGGADGGPGMGCGADNTSSSFVDITGGEIYAEGNSGADDIGDALDTDVTDVYIDGDSVVFLKNNSIRELTVRNHQYRTSGTITVAEGAEYGSAYGYTNIPASWGDGNSAYAYIPMEIDTTMVYRFQNVAKGEYLQTDENAAQGSHVSADAKATSATQTFKLADADNGTYYIESCETPGLYWQNDYVNAPPSLAPGYKIILTTNTSNGVYFYFNQDDEGNVKIYNNRDNKVVSPIPESISTEIYLLSVEDDNDYQEWIMTVSERYQVVLGKLRITYYDENNKKERMDVYYGETLDTGIQSRYLYDETGLKTQMTAYNAEGKRTTMTKYHDNGKAKYKYFYNTATNVKKSMMSYSEAGVQIAKTEYYANGVSAKRQYLYYASGKKKIIKNFRTNKKLSSQTWFYTDGTSKKQFNTYDINGNLTSVSKYYMNGTRYYYKKY